MSYLSKTFPNPYKAPDPISCISFSNSYTKEVKDYYLGDYNTEYEMTEAFIRDFKKEEFDLMIFYNGDLFDVPYLNARIPDFAKKISPIGQERWVTADIRHPAGISVIDYLKWDKKVTLNRRPKYSLDAVLETELGNIMM